MITYEWLILNLIILVHQILSAEQLLARVQLESCEIDEWLLNFEKNAKHVGVERHFEERQVESVRYVVYEGVVRVIAELYERLFIWIAHLECNKCSEETTIFIGIVTGEGDQPFKCIDKLHFNIFGPLLGRFAIFYVLVFFKYSLSGLKLFLKTF